MAIGSRATPFQLAARAACAAFLLGAASGCPHTNTPVELAARDPAALPRMNTAVLGSAGILVVQVDWVRGEEPLASSLDALRGWLQKESARPRERIEVRRGSEVAPEKADSTERAIIETVVARAKRDGDAFVYVLFWDRFERYRGVTWASYDLDTRAPFPVVVMATESVKHDAHLWLTRKKVERAVLVHEFGHVAGLVTSGRRVHDGHCPNPRCRMYHGPDWPAIKANAFNVICLGRLPLDFCEACEAELAHGRGADGERPSR